MKRMSGIVASILLFCGSALGAVVEYAYDEIGRLVAVYAPNGEAAQYVYDAAGNITEIKRFTATQLAIIEFTPNSGPVGTVVTIWGNGFSTTPANNTVTFNGTGATVSAATARKLTVTVPSGATTGLIGVTVGGSSTQSASNFTVTTGGGAPTITGFSPGASAAGTSITISGTNFETTPSKNVLNFNLTSASATASTATSITATVPAYAASGKIRVQTPYGIATSTNDFLIPFGTYPAADLITSARTTVNGTPASFNINTNGKVGVVMFEGNQGQRLGIAVGPLTFTPAGSTAIVNVVRPDNIALLPQTSAGTAGTTIDLPPLPLTGTYSVVIAPDATHKVSGTVTVSTEVTAAAGSAGNITNLSITRAGQNARLTFAGTSGQQVAVYLHNIASALQWSRVDLIDPWGLNIGTANSVNASGYLFPKTLPVTGTYTIFVTPQTLGTGAFSVQYGMPDLAITSFTPGAPSPNQNGSYAMPFTATIANQGTVGIKGFLTWVDRMFLSSNSTLDTADVATYTYQRSTDLASGASYSLNFTGSAPIGTAAGSYTAFLKTDTTNAGSNYSTGEYYVESNETNNVASGPVTIPGLPDLSISNLAVGTITVNPNQSYSIPITFTVTNVGGGAAQAPWYDYCYLSTDGTLGAGDLYIGYSTRGTNLAASASYNGAITCTTATTTLPGNYTLFARADSNDGSTYMGYQVLTEASETNNATGIPITLPNK